jgi:7-carboxy-7-deazaguanine synthase
MAIVQNADINVGLGHYRNMKPDELLITSIFFTIQGEGPFAGQPAIFVRLAGCNRGRKEEMGCEFCDTKFHYDQGQPLSFLMIERRMAAALDLVWENATRPAGLPLVVITGGEPMMQANLEGAVEFLWNRGYSRIQIESNGDRIIPDLIPLNRNFLTIVVSPKVTDGRYRNLKQAVYDRADALKFVIDADPASPYHGVPDYAFQFPREVYLSPLACYREGVKVDEVASAWDHSLIDAERTKANYSHAAALAMKWGFKLSIQSHLFASVP